MRYLEVTDEQLVIRASARDLLLRGALLLFGVPWLVAIVGWGLFALLAEPDSPLALAIAWALVAIGCAVPAIIGFGAMATANSRARASQVRIDLGEKILERPGKTPEVFRTPRAVRVRRQLLGWSLELQGESNLVLLRRVPHGSGPALAEAAVVLADHLGVEARVPRTARRAVGLIPHDEDLWAALCYAPVDPFPLAYSVFALLSSRNPRVRFAAKQSLVLLGVELFLALCLAGCLGIPLVVAAAPLALEAAAFLCPFFVFAILRVTIRMIAAVRARRGAAWVMPWLSPVVRRWAPGD